MEENIMTTENTEVQAPVVEEPTAVTEETSTTEETPVADEQPAERPPEKKPQSREVNHQFKLMRQEQERLQRQIAEQQTANSRLLEALKGYGYEGTPEEIAVQITAAQRGISPEELQAQEQQAAERAKELMQNDPEFLAMKQKAEAYEQVAFDNLFKADLAAIKKAFPDFKGKSIDELGGQFAALRANGVDAVTAYAAMQQAKQATEKPVPPVMGAVNQTKTEKEFYTSEELDRLTDKDLDDPSIFARAMRSMTRLGRK